VTLMKSWLLRVGLTVGLGWSLAVSSASAQDNRPPAAGVQPVSLQGPGPVIHDMRAVTAPMTAMPPLTGMMTAPMVATPPEYAPTVPIIPKPDDNKSPSFLHKYLVDPAVTCLRGHGFLCYMPHEYPCCTSIRGDWIFFFGSCRQFFGEPCAAGATPPPWFQGGGGGGAGGGNCPCRQ
jgi:hypothetical protein